MFTGIITDVGEIARIEKIKDIQAKIFCTYDVQKWSLVPQFVAMEFV